MGAPSLRLLVVDDLEPNRRLHAELARACGYSVDTASNGREAVEAAERVAYDCILTDIDMPVMNGIEAIHAIRALEAEQKRDPAVIIAVTGSEAPAECLRAGADYYVSKLDREVLTGMLQRLAQALDG